MRFLEIDKYVDLKIYQDNPKKELEIITLINYIKKSIEYYKEIHTNPLNHEQTVIIANVIY